MRQNGEICRKTEALLMLCDAHCAMRERCDGKVTQHNL